VVIGSDGSNLHFSSVRLAPYPVVAGGYVHAGARQGETRSHGFFYNERQGLLGLPIIGGRQASVLYLRNQSLHFAEIGTLGASPRANGNDGCRASCVDWYGNSRPLFIHNRVFALMGYELVEGEIVRGRIAERQRRSFAPVSREWP